MCVFFFEDQRKFLIQFDIKILDYVQSLLIVQESIRKVFLVNS